MYIIDLDEENNISKLSAYNSVIFVLNVCMDSKIAAKIKILFFSHDLNVFIYSTKWVRNRING